MDSIFLKVLSIYCVCSFTVLAQENVPLAAKFQPGFHPGLNNELESSLWMIMDKAEAEIKTSPSRIQGKLLNDYLHQILCQLSEEYCLDIRIYVTRTPYFNASMAPNGMMVIWTGLLLRVQNEAQLAAVLGHELGHYLLRHSVDNFKQAKKKTSIGAFFTAGLGGIGSMVHLGLVASAFAHGRSAEHEADLFGLQLMAKAGYDPYEAAKVWENIIEENNFAKHKKSQPVFFATHPNPKNRIEKLNSMADKTFADIEAPTNKKALNFNTVISPYWEMLLQDELKLNTLGKSEFVINNLISTDIVPGVTKFYLGELFRLRKEEGDFDLAVQAYTDALSYDEHPPEVYRSLGLLQLKNKEIKMAKSNFQQYLSLLPDAEDKEMIEFYLTME